MTLMRAVHFCNGNFLAFIYLLVCLFTSFFRDNALVHWWSGNNSIPPGSGTVLAGAAAAAAVSPGLEDVKALRLLSPERRGAQRCGRESPSADFPAAGRPARSPAAGCPVGVANGCRAAARREMAAQRAAGGGAHGRPRATAAAMGGVGLLLVGLLIVLLQAAPAGTVRLHRTVTKPHSPSTPTGRRRKAKGLLSSKANSECWGEGCFSFLHARGAVCLRVGRLVRQLVARDPAESCISVSSALKNRRSSVVGHQDCTFRE